jgi:hypothetical protein
VVDFVLKSGNMIGQTELRQLKKQGYLIFFFVCLCILLCDPRPTRTSRAGFVVQ